MKRCADECVKSFNMATNNIDLIYWPARQQTGLKHYTVEINVTLSKYNLEQRNSFHTKSIVKI